MTEENKNDKYYVSKEYKLFLSTIFSSFVGCLLAILLYSAALKPNPPAPVCPCTFYRMQFEEFAPEHFEHPKMQKQFKKGEHKRLPIKEEAKK